MRLLFCVQCKTPFLNLICIITWNLSIADDTDIQGVILGHNINGQLRFHRPILLLCNIACNVTLQSDQPQPACYTNIPCITSFCKICNKASLALRHICNRVTNTELYLALMNAHDKHQYTRNTSITRDCRVLLRGISGRGFNTVRGTHCGQNSGKSL